MISKQEFERYQQQGYNRIPLTMEVLADMDTPLSTYLKLAEGPYTYLFESVQGGERWGRYSIIGLAAKQAIRIDDERVSFLDSGKWSEPEKYPNPMSAIADFKSKFNVAHIEGLPKFYGGLVGYFGYETAAYFEPKLNLLKKKDDVGTPDVLLMLSEEVIVFDNLTGKIQFIVLVDPEQENAYKLGVRRLTLLRAMLRRPYQGTVGQPLIQPQRVDERDFTSQVGEETFHQWVEQAREYIMAGDIMQVVLSQRMSIDFDGDPMNIYRALRSLNPSPYMYFLNLDDFHVVGSSPEILARYEEGEVTVRPIAGTRKRGATDEQDKALEKELLEDPKELAEHLMLIDLGRNDVGRISKVGSVKLKDRMVIERYSHVMHIVSSVTGQALEEVSALEVLSAAHPAGTLSGAPKVRAMEIIDELETTKRGIYGGAVGYIGWDDNMDLAIAIRTAVIKNKTLYIQAGAGVVADSEPVLEWQETKNKGRAMFRAVAMAQSGLDN